MDITEKIYESVVRWTKRRQENELELSRYYLQDCDKALALLVQPFFDDSIEIHSSKQSGVIGRVLYLPEAITFFSNPHRNRDLYIHQALYLAAAQKMNIHWPDSGKDPYTRAAHFARNKAALHSQISEVYPSFPDFHQDLRQEFFERLKKPTTTAAQRVIQMMSSESFFDGGELNLSSLKRNEPFPEDLWLLWGGLCSFSKARNSLPEKSIPPRTSKNEKENEKTMQTHFEKEEVDLEKEEHNPVTHSFEKMETVDEYQGGSRVADGSNQLQEHSDALQEIQPRHVTRSGEAAEAFFKSEAVQGLSRDSEGSSFEPGEEYFFYPEWHFKKRQLLQDFCRLKVNTLELGAEPKLKVDLLEKQGPLISRCRSQLDELRNKRKWRGGAVGWHRGRPGCLCTPPQ